MLISNTLGIKRSEFDGESIRASFPILSHPVHGSKRLAYFDSAASAQKPLCVTQAMSHFCDHDYANIHRGVHELSMRATTQYEDARKIVQAFLRAPCPSNMVFTKNATEAINLVAHGLGELFAEEEGEILISELEHHSNIVPWQMLCKRSGLKLKIKIIPVTDDGMLDMEAFHQLCTKETKLVAIAHVSNVLGTIVPVDEIIHYAHQQGALVLVDGCQAVPHIPVDVVAMDADFYVFTGHKVYGPTGIGVLYGKQDLLDRMPPYQTGGGMIRSVSFEGTEFAKGAEKFEAGTPPIVEAIGLSAAITYLKSFSRDDIIYHEAYLLEYLLEHLLGVEGVSILGSKDVLRVGVVSFEYAHAHAHDIGTLFDSCGVAVRVGHHCAQPLMARFKTPAVVRASLGIYNCKEDIDQLIDAFSVVKKIFG